HPTVARALRARRRVDRPVPLALRARPRGHHLAEERPLHLLDLPGALTGGTRVELHTLGGSTAMAHLTHHCRVDQDFLGGTEYGFGKVDLQPHPGVLTAADAAARGARRRPAEEGVHDVGERKRLAETSPA